MALSEVGQDERALSGLRWDGRVPTWPCPKQGGMDAPCLGYGGTDTWLVRPMTVRTREIHSRVERTRVTWQHGSRSCHLGTVESVIFAITAAKAPFLLMSVQIVSFMSKTHSFEGEKGEERCETRR